MAKLARRSARKNDMNMVPTALVAPISVGTAGENVFEMLIFGKFSTKYYLF